MKYMLLSVLLVPALLCSTSCSVGKKQTSKPVAQKKVEIKEASVAPDSKRSEVKEPVAVAEPKRDLEVGVEEITTQEGFDALFAQGLPVAVKFYGTFCPPCRRMKPIFEKLAQDFAGQIRLVAIEVQQPGVRALAQAYASHGVPSFVVFDKTGKYLATRLGAATEAELSRFIAGHCLGQSI